VAIHLNYHIFWCVLLCEDSVIIKNYPAVFACSETNDGGCVNDQELRDFTVQFLRVPSQLTRQHGQCLPESSNDDCSVQKSRYMPPEEQQSFTYTVINPAFAGTMRGISVLQQIVPHHCSSVKVGVIILS